MMFGHIHYFMETINDMKKRITTVFKVVMATLGLLIIISLWLISPLKRIDADVLSNKNFYVAHAAGAIDGITYLNCKEALLHSLENGYKYIELDLGLTEDSSLVCIHDWDFFLKKTGNDTIPLTKDDFKKRMILGKYTPLALEDVLFIRDSNPFIIVTDKISDPNILNKYFEKNREQIMVEAFNISDYKELKNDGYVPMMSLWKFDFQKIFWYFIYYPIKYHFKIDWVCVDSSSNMKSLRVLKRLFNCKVAMYKSNSYSFFEEHLGKEIDLIYTDNWNFGLNSANNIRN